MTIAHRRAQAPPGEVPTETRPIAGDTEQVLLTLAAERLFGLPRCRTFSDSGAVSAEGQE
jgi:hypothetical protein